MVLRKHGDPAKIQEAIEKYNSENWLTRKDALMTLQEELKKRNSPEIAMTIEKVFLNASLDDHIAIRIKAAEGLSLLESSSSLAMLLNLASPRSPVNVRWSAIKALASRNSPLATSVYVRGLSDNDWLIRKASVKGLLRLKDTELKNRYINLILKALKDPVINVRVCAMDNLSLQDRRIYRAITANIYQGKPGILLISSLKAIRGYQLDNTTREKLIDMLNHPRIKIRILALRALQESRRIRLLKREISEG